MSKSIKVLLLTLLALSLAFSAAFAKPTAVKVTVNPTATGTGTDTNSSYISKVNPITITIGEGGALTSDQTGTIGVQYKGTATETQQTQQTDTANEEGTGETWNDLTGTETTVTALQFTYKATANDNAEPVTLDGEPVLGTATGYTITIAADGTLSAVADTAAEEEEETEQQTQNTEGDGDGEGTETGDTASPTFKAKLTDGKLTLTLTPVAETEGNGGTNNTDGDGDTTTTALEVTLNSGLTGTYGEEVPFEMTASAIIRGVLVSMEIPADGTASKIETVDSGYKAPTDATTTDELNNYVTVFLADKTAVLTGKLGDVSATSTVCLSYDATANNYFLYYKDDEENVILTAENGLTSKDGDNKYAFDMTLGVAKIEEDYFDSSDITVFDGVSAQTTSASKTKKSAQLYVALSADVSIDIAETDEVISVSWDNAAQTADSNGYYVISSKDMGASGDKKVVVIKFKDGLDSCDFTLTLVVSGDSSSSATAETYKLSLASTDKFVFTGSNGQSATFTASVDKYSASSALASVDASGAWGTMTFNVSSDVFADFVISVDFPASASVAAVYYREGTTGSYTDAEDDYTAKVLTPLEGYYRLVFSADLVASSDGVASGDGYFGFTIQVVSVDSSSESSSTLVEETAASVEPVTRSDGNKEIPAGRKISTKFLSNGSLTSTIVSAFFENADSVEMATPEEITAALTQLGFSASDLGDATNGYKIVGLALSDELKALLYDGMKFFVMITTDKDGSGEKALGMGVLSSKQLNLNFLPIVFKLLKNPADTNNYMTFPAGNYFVGATNDMGETSGSTSARVVFVTADDQTFTIAADEKTLLQGQNASGDAQAYTGDDDDDDDDNQETSSHGSSSGCDAGFGALALLAVAGALAARKVRK